MKRSLILATSALALLFGCTRVNPGHVGIVVHMAGSDRGVQDYAPTTGWVFYNPLSTSVLEYPTFMQTYAYTRDTHEGNAQNEEITFTNQDQMLIAIDVNVAYHIDPAKVPEFYVQFRNDDLKQFTYGYLRNTIRDCFNFTAGQYTIEQIMGDNGKFLKAARDCTQEAVLKYGVVIEQFGIIGAPRPPEAVIQSIAAKVQAQQLAMQKQNEILQATADAQKAVAKAEGEAKSKIALAAGEAEANRKLAESITTQLIEWRRLGIQEQAVGRWDGRRPAVEGAPGAGFLLSIDPEKK